jgi:hypothetical protein
VVILPISIIHLSSLNKEPTMSAKKALSKLPVTESADPKVLDEVYKSLIVMQRKPEKKDEAITFGNTLFHEDYILKKAHSEWKKYWAVLKGDRLLFYASKEVCRDST